MKKNYTQFIVAGAVALVVSGVVSSASSGRIIRIAQETAPAPTDTGGQQQPPPAGSPPPGGSTYMPPPGGMTPPPPSGSSYTLPSGSNYPSTYMPPAGGSGPSGSTGPSFGGPTNSLYGGPSGYSGGGSQGGQWGNTGGMPSNMPGGPGGSMGGPNGGSMYGGPMNNSFGNQGGPGGSMGGPNGGSMYGGPNGGSMNSPYGSHGGPTNSLYGGPGSYSGGGSQWGGGQWGGGQGSQQGTFKPGNDGPSGSTGPSFGGPTNSLYGGPGGGSMKFNMPSVGTSPFDRAGKPGDSGNTGIIDPLFRKGQDSTGTQDGSRTFGDMDMGKKMDGMSPDMFTGGSNHGGPTSPVNFNFGGDQGNKGGFGTGAPSAVSIPGLQQIVDFAGQSESEGEVTLSEKEVKAITTVVVNVITPVNTLEISWKKLAKRLPTMKKQKAISAAKQLGTRLEPACNKVAMVEERVSEVSLVVDNAAVDKAESDLETASGKCDAMMGALLDIIGAPKSDL